MTRPVTIFTGQWANYPLAELAPRMKAIGYDGLEPNRFTNPVSLDFFSGFWPIDSI